jgi:hypothetical protein
MALPPLYKYLDLKGAKLTLGNKCFRHAKPSDFNDLEDMTIGSIFPEDLEAALKKLSEGFIDVVLAHLDDPPTCASPQREKLQMIQYALRKNPSVAETLKAEQKKRGSPYDVEHMRARAQAHVELINGMMQNWRVLCVTTEKNSARMWTEYAENYKGVVLRIEPNVAKDSKFQLFRPVIYREKRPPLYDDTLEFLAGSLFGDLATRVRAIIETIVYAKTLKWEHECEYRLAVPLGQGEEPYDTKPYHPDEITEIYLGGNMDAKDMDEILALAFAVNPDIKTFMTSGPSVTASSK